MSSPVLVFEGPDGTYRASSAFSTSSPERFFRGTVPDTAVDIEVSLFDLPYSTDPALVFFSGTAFIIPNPSAYPEGLPLSSGPNRIAARARNVYGIAESEGSVEVSLVPSEGLVFPPPTEIVLERGSNSVSISARVPDDARFRGVNVYVATEPGGGADGYRRVNARTIAESSPRATDTPLFTLGATGTRAETDGPLYLRTRLTQESGSPPSTETLSIDADSRVEIPAGAGELVYSVSIGARTSARYATFEHDRSATPTSATPTISLGSVASRRPTDPLYYVLTAVYYDPEIGVEYESYYSAEVAGGPLSLRATPTALPAVSRQQLLETAITSIYRSQPSLAVTPGSVLRDTVLDPATAEFERMRFLLDFLYRASSFDTLLAIDDPNGTGISIAPAASPYKRALADALYLANVGDVQAVIDAAFEKLAANFDETRESGRRASGEVRFYTSSTPSRTLPIPLGTVVAGRYRTTRAAELPVDRLASFYDPLTRQYSVRVPVEAIEAGPAGNVTRGQVSSGAPGGFSVINDSDLDGGIGRDSNAALAAKARGRLAAVDSGSPEGIRRIATRTAGVTSVEIVRPGDDLMRRDVENGVSRGGKVDVWVGGTRNATVSETFAFRYEKKNAVRFEVVGDPRRLRFRAVDPDLSESRPIAAMIVREGRYGLRNATEGAFFNLAGVSVVSYDTIQLNPLLTQPPVAYGDVLLGDYRLGTSTRYVLARQPVLSIFSVVGERTGTVEGSSISLVHPSSPLNLGGSTLAGDYLEILPSTDPTAILPSGEPIEVDAEVHVLTGSDRESVFHLGADSLSFSVTDSPPTLTYRGPLDPGGDPDYDLIEGTETEPLRFYRTATSRIPDGGTVAVSYSYEENLVVTYLTSALPGAVSDRLAALSHSGSSILAKSKISVPVDLTVTVVLSRGIPRSDADTRIRRNLAYAFGLLRSGETLRRSAILSVIQKTDGVSYVISPLTKMSRGAGSFVLQEELDASASVRLDGYSDARTGAWILGALSFPTYEGGGKRGEWRGVYDGVRLLSPVGGDLSSIAADPYTYAFLTAAGATIPRYSDDATLLAAGFTTDDARSAERLRRTANRVLVSLPIGESPYNRTYRASYGVKESIGERDLPVSVAETLVPGSFVFTYEEERA